MAQSGFLSDARGAAQASVKILAGREKGFPPLASMVGISIIEGKPAAGANLLAGATKRARYTWRVVQRDTKGCMLILSYKGSEIGPAEFLEENARCANLLNKRNWQQYPLDVFSRAVSAMRRARMLLRRSPVCLPTLPRSSALRRRT